MGVLALSAQRYGSLGSVPSRAVHARCASRRGAREDFSGGAFPTGPLGTDSSTSGGSIVDLLRVVAVGYIRVSTEGQAEDGVSLDAQREKIAAWAKLNDESEVLVYEDAGISGSSIEQRPGLQDALREACRRRAALVVFSLSRLARSTRDTLAISDRLAKAGAELVSLSERIDTTSASGKMVFRLLAVLAEFERDQVSERTRVAMAHLRRSHRRISRHVPFGWTLGDDGRTLQVAPAEQEALVRIRELRAAGRSFREIAGHLNDSKVATKTGVGLWGPSVVRRVLRRLPA